MIRLRDTIIPTEMARRSGHCPGRGRLLTRGIDVAQGTCTAAEGCEGTVLARGLCRRHYERARTDGSLEVLVRRTLAERVWAKIQRVPNGCWQWTGAVLPNGYGQIGTGGSNGVTGYAHRVVYELLVGPIPEGFELDHGCHNADPSCPGGWECAHRRCVNPSHVEPVPPAVNRRRGQTLGAVNLRKTHCPEGHPLSGENLYVDPSGGRECRRCRRIKRREHYVAHRHNASP